MSPEKGLLIELYRWSILPRKKISFPCSYNGYFKISLMLGVENGPFKNIGFCKMFVKFLGSGSLDFCKGS